MLALLVSLLLVLALGFSHMLLKMVSLSHEQSLADAYLANTGKLASAVIIYIVLFCIYPWILRAFPISIIFPAYTGFTIFIVMVASAVFFGEPVNATSYLGAGLLVTGIVLIAISGTNQN